VLCRSPTASHRVVLMHEAPASAEFTGDGDGSCVQRRPFYAAANVVPWLAWPTAWHALVVAHDTLTAALPGMVCACHAGATATSAASEIAAATTSPVIIDAKRLRQRLMPVTCSPRGRRLRPTPLHM
jgi:hypothetical protein